MVDTHIRVAVYSPDEAAIDTLRGLVGERGEVVPQNTPALDPADLILVDLASPHSSVLLTGLILARHQGLLETTVLAVISANPFAIASVSDVDALLAKPLSTEQVQALLAGVRARLRA